MTRRIRRPAAAGLALLLTLVASPLAQAADPPAIVVEDGVTQPVFGYADAIRERVFIDADVDSDLDGLDDIIAVDVIRPAATELGLKVPAIIDDSPYYSTLGRGNESELKADDAGGLLARWPLFYDNYFVPRGYAVVLVDMTGTNHSTGCPTIQGHEENVTGPVVVDWLNGRRVGVDGVGNPVAATWHNGRAGMIGKSYDGALAAAGAVSGVDGLTTVVPISGPYNYYDYTRSNGIIQRGSHYLASLANTVTNPARRAYCLPTRNRLSANDGDATGDYSDFWRERDYLPDVPNVKASVFLVHGIQDENVRPDHMSKFWDAISERNVPRKLWIGRLGHVEPFDFRRTEWVATIHRWFDHWLQGIENGIMDEPMVDVERSPGTWETSADWPVPGTASVDLWLRPGTASNTNGLLSISAGDTAATTAFTDSSTQSENTMINNPTTVTNNRRVFLSAPLTAPLRLSGTPVVRLRASANRTDTNLGAIIVDYGSSTQSSRNGDGISQTPAASTEDCFGLSSPTDDGCYRRVNRVLQNVSQWRVTKGILDVLNRNSLTTPEPLVIGEAYDFAFPMLPEDFVFPVGHRIGIVIVGSYSGYSSQADTTGATITLDLQLSRISLPIAGGYQALVDSGAFLPDVNAPVVTVPDDIVVDAVAPDGAPVSYEASVSDAEDPAPALACVPPSGSTFPVGTTTVGCTGTDGAGNATVETFEVHVKGAPEQLDDLIVGLAGVGPGTAFADKARIIRDELLAGNVGLACLGLTRSFPQSVGAQVGKKLTQAQADAILAELAHLAVVAGCG